MYITITVLVTLKVAVDDYEEYKISFTPLPQLWLGNASAMGGWGHLLVRALVHVESRFPEGPRCCIGSLSPKSVFFLTAG